MKAVSRLARSGAKHVEENIGKEQAQKRWKQAGHAALGSSVSLNNPKLVDLVAAFEPVRRL